MRYEVTGTDRGGKRFKISTTILAYALSINLWRGSVWEVVDGKRTRIKEVWN